MGLQTNCSTTFSPTADQIMTPSGRACPLVRFGLPALVPCRSVSFTQITLRGRFKESSPKETIMRTSASSEISWNSPRWDGIFRTYEPADVERLRGTVRVEHSLARRGAERFWSLLHREKYIPALGALDRKSTRLNSSHLVISYA